MGLALHDGRVALVVGVLQDQQRDQQADGQALPASVAGPGAEEFGRGAEQIRIGDGTTRARSMGKQRCQRGFELRSEHSRRAQGQRLAHVDRLIQTCTEEVVSDHRRIAFRTPKQRGALRSLPGNLTIDNHS